MRRAVGTAAVAAALVAASVGLAATSVNGVYVTKLSGKTPAVLNGTWTVSIAQSRAYAIAKGGKTVVGGKLTIAGPRLTFHDVVGPLACTGATAVGVYSYSLVGKTLRLKRVADRCAGRVAVLTSAAFTRVR